MEIQNKHSIFDVKINLQIILIVTLMIGGWIWTISKAYSEMEGIDTRVHKNTSTIQQQTKIINKIAIDIGKISVQVDNQQQQTREMKIDITKIRDLLQSVLIEVKK